MNLNAKTTQRSSGVQSETAMLPNDLLYLIARAKQTAGDRILRLPLVRERTGRASATIWKDVGQKTFPPPISIGPRAVGWRESEVNAWLEACSFATRSRYHFDMATFIAQLIGIDTPIKERTAERNQVIEGGRNV